MNPILKDPMKHPALTIVENLTKHAKSFLLSKFDENGKIVFINADEKELRKKLENKASNQLYLEEIDYVITSMGEFRIIRYQELTIQPVPCILASEILP